MIGTGTVWQRLRAAGIRAVHHPPHRAGRGEPVHEASGRDDARWSRAARSKCVLYRRPSQQNQFAADCNSTSQRLRRVARPRSEDSSPVDSVVKIFEVGADKRARPQTSEAQPQL